ncbi:MAG: hypothetical protein RBR06_04325 [Desulfuromonadaceae bacterium]|nr:hypothetical protein [Desulfuromonadaceae bacterium]
MPGCHNLLGYIWLLCLLLASCSAGPNVKLVPPLETTSPSAWEENHLVLQALDALIDAYENKNSIGFFRFVSDRYMGDDIILESRIRDTLRRSHDISIRYTVDNITSDKRGKSSVAVTFTREYTEIKTTQRVVRTGQAILVFVRKGGEYRLLSQISPLF